MAMMAAGRVLLLALALCFGLGRAFLFIDQISDAVKKFGEELKDDLGKVEKFGEELKKDLDEVVGSKAFPYSLDGAEEKLNSPRSTQRTEVGKDCECIGYNCGCCLVINLPEIGLNDKVCANILYLPADYGFSVTLSVDDHVLFNETDSVHNPPAICAAIPYLKKEASLCLAFYNLDISASTFSGCLKIEGRLFVVLKEDYDLGCFDMGDLLSSPVAPGMSKQQHATVITSVLRRVKRNLQLASEQPHSTATSDKERAVPVV